MKGLGQPAIEKCPNLSTLSFLDFDIDTGDKHKEQIALFMSQLRAMGGRLKSLVMSLSYHYRSHHTHDVQEIEIRKLDTQLEDLLENLRVLALRMVNDNYKTESKMCSTSLGSPSPLSQLLHFRLFTWSQRRLRWSTVMKFLQAVPSLQELYLGSFELVDDNMNTTLAAVAGSGQREISGVSQAKWQHRSLRKLTIKTRVTIDMAHSMIDTFPDLLELDVAEMAHFWVPPPSASLSSYKLVLDSNDNVLWSPFSRLRRLTVQDPRLTSNPNVMTCTGRAFPQSLKHLIIVNESYKFPKYVSRLEQQLCLSLRPGLVLETLHLELREELLLLSFLDQDCCARLRSLTLGWEGPWILAQMLSRERTQACHDPISLDADWESSRQEWDTMTIEFVQSRIRCAETLRSLAFKQKSCAFGEEPTLVLVFVNRLLRCLPELQDLELTDGVRYMSDLMGGLGEPQEGCGQALERNQEQEQEQKQGQEPIQEIAQSMEVPAATRTTTISMTAHDTGCGVIDNIDTVTITSTYASDANGQWPLGGPSLRTLNLTVWYYMDRVKETKLLQGQFRYLEEVWFELDHNDDCACDSCGMGFGIFD
ncbi:hypothetical protein BGZ83_005335 [Gryganskiella cystojenkinii]|nr:hypothetical protein BGZ83_005335 [Gryganskiella cystojenkinii]